MKFKSLAVVAAIAALSAVNAQAGSFSDFAGVQHAEQLTGLETSISALFSKEYAFTLDGTYDVSTTFLSSGLTGFFGVFNADDTPVAGLSWNFGGKPFVATPSFTLDSGSYYYAVTGIKGTGSFTLSSAVVAAPVPEPETYAMLAAGLGIVGFVASRRRRND